MTDLKGQNRSLDAIENFEVTPGIWAILKCRKFAHNFQGDPPGSDARAIIWVKKLMNYVDFVIKYFMSPQNIGENKVGVEIDLFFLITVLH